MPPLLALFCWPFAVVALARKFPPALAFILAILVGFLLLPELTAFDLPLLPALDKHSVPVLSVLLFLALFRPGKGQPEERGLIPEHPFIWIATIGLIAGTFLTVATNGDPLQYGPRTLPGIRLYDGFSQALATSITLLPMLLARKFLATPETHVLLLKVLCVAALGYSLLALFEVRMSPQLNRWIYGFFPHSWLQHYRAGGWRPIVFLSHGLVVSIFFCCATLATAGLSRVDARKRGIFLAALAWLFMTLILTKSLGALGIAILLLPAALFWKARSQLLMACCAAILVLSYPVARSRGFIPVDWVIQQAGDIDPQRAQSLQYRIDNEDKLLAKAEQRPLFGWGIWGRSRVFDPVTGADISVTDGQWVILIGTNGWVGYIFRFGLLCLPLILLLRHARRYEIGLESSILGLVLAANLIDLLPNASLTPITWMIAGALWGRLELQRISPVAEPVQDRVAERAFPAYTRTSDPPEDLEAPSTRRARYTRQRTRHKRKTLHDRE